MNLARHLSVLWRFRLLVALGLVLACGLAFLAAYGLDGKRRGSETWTSTSRLFVTQTGFPWGRTTLPSTEDGAGTTTDTTTGDNNVQFGDPIRFASAAQLYTVLSTSDEIRNSLPEKPLPSQISITALDYFGNGNSPLPILETTTQAASAAGAQELNRHLIEAMRGWLKREQDAARPEIPDEERIELSVVSAPSEAVKTDGPTMTPSILAFVLVALATLALAHILEALRPRTREQASALPADAEPAREPAIELPTVYGVELDGDRDQVVRGKAGRRGR